VVKVIGSVRCKLNLFDEIAKALTVSPPYPSATLETLIRLAKAHRVTLSNDVVRLRQAMLAPVPVDVEDLRAARQTHDEAQLDIERIDVALKSLEALRDKVHREEDEAALKADMERVRAESEALAARFVERYSALAAELICLLDELSENREAVEAVNRRLRPPTPWIPTAEMIAREADRHGVERRCSLMANETRLPALKAEDQAHGQLWPRPPKPVDFSAHLPLASAASHLSRSSPG
jgi:DNA primase